MTTLDFSPLYRSTIGFDRMMPWFEDAARYGDSDPGYPPYNIEKRSEDDYRITMAVAGFTEDDLIVETHEDKLVVRGARQASDGERTYLHRGIPARPFERVFQLADFVRVDGARLNDGLLHIDLKRELPEEMKPRRIEITSGGPGRLFSRLSRAVEGSEAA